MSEDLAASSDSGGVSPTRKKVSAAILVVLLVILLIEVRAGAGHSISGKALQAACPDGAFENTQLSDVEAMMTLSPSRTLIWETPAETGYRYSWFSVLRPLLQRPEASLYVVSSKDTDPLYARRYSTEAPTEKEIAAAKEQMKVLSVDFNEEEGGSEEDGSGGDFGGPGGGPPARRPPPEDPSVKVLDADGDGTLNATELEGASDALFAADKNGDGKLTPDELPVPEQGGRPSEGRQRPALDDSDEDAPSKETVEPKADEADTENPAKPAEETKE